LSGPAVEKPPQANDSIVREDSFSYRIFCVNAPEPFDNSIFSKYNVWQPQSYSMNSMVLDNWAFWRATMPTQATDVPGQSAVWAREGDLNLGFVFNLHELRLSFLWPQLPSGGLGPGRQTFRTAVAGRLVTTLTNNQALYFYQSQTFTNAP
jgi:hypothetical protein